MDARRIEAEQEAWLRSRGAQHAGHGGHALGAGGGLGGLAGLGRRPVMAAGAGAGNAAPCPSAFLARKIQKGVRATACSLFAGTSATATATACSYIIHLHHFTWLFFLLFRLQPSPTPSCLLALLHVLDYSVSIYSVQHLSVAYILFLLV